MIEGSLIVFGVMLSYWLDLGFSFLEPSSIAWRFPIAFQIILALFILALIPGLPESPRWLVLKGREDEALEVLAALSDLPPTDKKIEAEFQAVKDVIAEMSQGSFRDCFKFNKNRNFHRTALAYVNQMFQQVGCLRSSRLTSSNPLPRFLVSTSSPTMLPLSLRTRLVSHPSSVVSCLPATVLSTGSQVGLPSSRLKSLVVAL